MPLNWRGKIAFHCQRIDYFVQEMLCGDLSEAGREPVLSSLKFIGVLFEVRKSLSIFARRRSVRVLLLHDSGCDFSFHWKIGMPLLQPFCPQLPSLVQDQSCVPAQSNRATYFSETNYSSNKLLGNALVVSQNTVLYHSPKGILYQRSDLVITELINQIRPHQYFHFVKDEGSSHTFPWVAVHLLKPPSQGTGSQVKS